MDPQETARQPLRLAILASPRTGNNWLRTLLVRSYGLKPFAAHDAAEIPWDALPLRAVVNLHWLPTPDLLSRLDGFRVLTLARHPLDTLISILHFAPHHEATNRWLLGRGGNEDGIRSAAPTSPEFLDYATGPRPAELFAVTARWWDVPGVIRVRYEDLVADTPGELRRIAAEIGAPPVVPPEEA
ncbi:MAG TPA: hypothetical protein VF170_05340, partial [Planctomycetaceae bacterium]